MKWLKYIGSLAIGISLLLCFQQAYAIEISDTFRPGIGVVVGKVGEVKGEVIIQHADESIKIIPADTTQRLGEQGFGIYRHRLIRVDVEVAKVPAGCEGKY